MSDNWAIGKDLHLKKFMMGSCAKKKFEFLCYTSSLSQINRQSTEGCLGEQASLEFDLTYGDVFLHKLLKAY